MFVLLSFINRKLTNPTTAFQRIAISPFNTYLQHRVDIEDLIFLTQRVILRNNSYILWLFSTLRRKMIHQPGTNPANNTTCDAYLKTKEGANKFLI